jgi:small subunit ribosomal protein S20
LANTKQQRKRNRRALAQRDENRRYRSTIKTLFRRLDETGGSNGGSEMDQRSRELVRLIDRAAARGALHRNNAARKKRRVARILNRARTPEGAAS